MSEAMQLDLLADEEMAKKQSVKNGATATNGAVKRAVKKEVNGHGANGKSKSKTQRKRKRKRKR